MNDQTISFQHDGNQSDWSKALQESIRLTVEKTAEDLGKIRDEFTQEQLKGIIIELINSGDIVRYITAKGATSLTLVPGRHQQKIDDLKSKNKELLEALKTLMNQYADRKEQFGDDHLWERYEDSRAIMNIEYIIKDAEKYE